VDTKDAECSPAKPMSNTTPDQRTHSYPIVMIEGCCLAGAGYMARLTAAMVGQFPVQGLCRLFMDQVGRAVRPMSRRSMGRNRCVAEIGRARFHRYEKYNLFPHAKLPAVAGDGKVGDPIFDQFMAETLP